MYKQFFFVTKNKDWPCHLIIICVCEVHTLYREFCCLLGRSYFQGLKVGWQELLILTVTLNLLLWLWGHLLSTLTSGVLDVLMCWAITDVSESLFFFFLWLVIPSICPRFCYNQQFLEFSVMISTEADFVPHTYFLWLSHNSPASRKFYQWSLRLCQKCCELVGFSLSGHHWGSTTPKYV